MNRGSTRAAAAPVAFSAVCKQRECVGLCGWEELANVCGSPELGIPHTREGEWMTLL